MKRNATMNMVILLQKSSINCSTQVKQRLGSTKLVFSRIWFVVLKIVFLSTSFLFLYYVSVLLNRNLSNK
jgi:hypothetical protein